MFDDDNPSVRNPTPEQWEEMMKDSEFKKFWYGAMAEHPPPWITEEQKQFYKDEYKRILEEKEE